MLNVGPGTKTFLVTGATDLRKSYDTLAAIVSNTLQEDPYSGSLFAFANRGRNRVKLLLWDRSGFWLFCRRTQAEPDETASDDETEADSQVPFLAAKCRYRFCGAPFTIGY